MTQPLAMTLLVEHVERLLDMAARDDDASIADLEMTALIEAEVAQVKDLAGRV